MKSSLQFYACGVPKGQPRARAFRRGSHAGVYDPGTADAWKFAVREAAKDQWDGLPFRGALELRVVFFFPRPKNHRHASGQMKTSAPAFHLNKPDTDNCAKAVMDALTTLGVWADDKQVAVLMVRKLYGDQPGASITVSELEDVTP